MGEKAKILAEELWRKSEELHRTILMAAMDGFLLMDPEGALLEVNDAYCRMSGYREEELLALKLAGLCIPAQAGEVTAQLRQIKARGEGRFESRHLRRDGSCFEVEVSLQYPPGEDRFVGFVREITARKLAEQEKLLERQRLETILALNQMIHDPLDQIESFIVEQSVRQSASKMGFCGFLDSSREAMTTQIWSKEALRDCAVPGKPVQFPLREAGLWADVFRQGEPVVVNDYQGEVGGKRGVPLGHVPLHRFLGVPVMVNGAPFGIIAIANKAEEYNGTDLTHLLLLADGIGHIFRRRQDEERLRESEARYRRITEGLTDYQYTVRLENGRAVETKNSPTCLMTTGYSAEEFAADPYLWIEMVTPDDREMLRERIAQVLAGKEIAPIVHKIIRKDGEVRWVSDKIILHRSDSGTLLSYDGVIKDITASKQAEELLRQSEDKYRTLADFTYDWEYWLAPDGRFIYCSTACERITGYRAEEFVKDPGLFMAIVHPEDREQTQAHMDQLSASCSPGSDREFRILTRGGELRWIGHNCVTVHDRTGHYRGRRGCNRDITAQKRADEENFELHIRLNQAQKMEAIGILAGGIAHDFNNLLAVIIGSAELAGDELPLDSSIGKELERILTASRRAKDLVSQILAFSRRSLVSRIPMKIQPLVKESLKMLRSSIPSTITIKDELQPQSSAILADPTQIHQIVMNLCTNAFHAMEEKGGLLTVGLQNKTVASPLLGNTGPIAPGEYVELTVSDSGSGIGPDILGQIFDPYFTTKEVGKGTGMGLSITHGIVTGYGGAIRVESKLGQGTTFQVYFPAIAEESGHAPPAGETPRGKEHILFVDDEELMVATGQEMLEWLGYRVTARQRSVEALAAFIDNPRQFDLVLTDQTMPVMTGIELARRILAVRPGLPVILCTGYSNLVDEETAKAAGIRGFALKPLSKSALAQLVRKVLDQGSPPSVAGVTRQSRDGT